jgi:hypothetical protein
MKKTLVISTVFILLIAVGLCGCSEVEKQKNDDEDRIVGTWINSELYNGSTRDITYTFYLNNTGSLIVTYIGETFSSELNWRISDGKLLIDVFEPNESRLINDFFFSDNNNTLVLKDSLGNIMIFNRQ